MDVNDNNKRVTIGMENLENFYKKIVQRFWPIINSSTNIKAKSLQMYTYFEKLIEEEASKRLKPEQTYIDMHNALNKLYQLTLDENVIKKISSENMNLSDFMEKYKENVLGDEKRQYDMSKIFSLQEDQIMRAGNMQGERGRKIKFLPSISEPNIFIDENGTLISIELVGKLAFLPWNNIGNESITKYKVQRGEDEPKYVYSDINMIMMDESPAYRKVVLEELLGEKNIQLSNLSGYVGTITRTPIEVKGKASSKEYKGTQTYIYKINEEFSLIYEEPYASAVMLHEQYEKNIFQNTKSTIDAKTVQQTQRQSNIIDFRKAIKTNVKPISNSSSKKILNYEEKEK